MESLFLLRFVFREEFTGVNVSFCNFIKITSLANYKTRF